MRRRTPHEFAGWLHDQLTARGYSLSPRGGGQVRFAEAAGVSKATISRILRGEGSTDIAVLEKVGDALGVRLGVMLVEAGVIAPDELGGAQRPQGHMTADEAADALGITDPTARQVLRGVVDTLTPKSPPPGDPTAG
ncbi:helix-turn-helix domain-containing protein [Streptomyces sp. YPW6]|uniref:helix-turn-helix domain-containing protein n=1 Tax=Streptomyces sp. YPW6 TaxID=2840373 RepID=UPI001C0ABB57|nr:helix-turn-helix transcriptional regulator [Streptomyces sp. YPW6]QWQ43097.1 helix-turn-helix domain-containing protein [Streptomyces sp. YPW6]